MAREKVYDYAGFWLRFFANLIDTLLLTVPFVYLEVVYIDKVYALLLIGLCQLLINVGYYVYFEGHEGATIGKKAVGLRVIRANGQFPIGFEDAFLRYLGRLVSASLIFLGFVMIAIDSKKQGLHDKIAGTYVVHKDSIK
jgi:uncharacterized RDD family membrane protein YckC